MEACFRETEKKVFCGMGRYNYSCRNIESDYHQDRTNDVCNVDLRKDVLERWSLRRDFLNELPAKKLEGCRRKNLTESFRQNYDMMLPQKSGREMHTSLVKTAA